MSISSFLILETVCFNAILITLIGCSEAQPKFYAPISWPPEVPNLLELLRA